MMSAWAVSRETTPRRLSRFVTSTSAISSIGPWEGKLIGFFSAQAN